MDLGKPNFVQLLLLQGHADPHGYSYEKNLTGEDSPNQGVTFRKKVTPLWQAVSICVEEGQTSPRAFEVVKLLLTHRAHPAQNAAIEYRFTQWRRSLTFHETRGGTTPLQLAVQANDKSGQHGDLVQLLKAHDVECPMSAEEELSD